MYCWILSSVSTSMDAVDSWATITLTPKSDTIAVNGASMFLFSLEMFPLP
jgi:hypothetical protein